MFRYIHAAELLKENEELRAEVDRLRAKYGVEYECVTRDLADQIVALRAELARAKRPVVSKDLVKRLREAPHHFSGVEDKIEFLLTDAADEIERLHSLLWNARQYVSDAGSYEEPGEHQQALLADIDAVLKR
jgi:hypothetical protein